MEWAALALIAGVAAAVQTAIGFGALLLCVTLGAFVLPLPQVVALYVPLFTVQAALVVIRAPREVRWRVLGLRLLPLMGLGLVAGTLIAPAEEAWWMRPVLGVLVLGLALRELVGVSARAFPRLAPVGYALGGLAHGVFGVGGPPVVWGLGQEQLDKTALRSTMNAAWVPINSVLAGVFVSRGQLDGEGWVQIGTLLVPMVVGLVLGDWLHHRVTEHHFRRAVWGVLALAAVPLLV